MYKSIRIILVFLIVIAGLILPATATDITDCAILNTASESYNLLNSVTNTSTCFTISQSGIHLDGGNFSATYGTTTSSKYGITSSGLDNIMVSNIYLIHSNSSATSGHGVYLTATAVNWTFTNLDINTTAGYAMYLLSSNTITCNNCTLKGGASIGVYLSTTTDVTFNGGDISTNGGDKDYYLSGDINSLFVDTQPWNVDREFYLSSNSTIFRYNNSSSGVQLNSTYTGTSTIEVRRIFNNISQVNTTWQDKSASANTMNYTLIGLLPSTQYNVFEDGVLNQTFTTDASGNSGVFFVPVTSTAYKTIRVAEYGSSIGAPDITSYTPSVTTYLDTLGHTSNFSITANQTVNVTWYVDGNSVSTDTNVTTSTYSNSSNAIGIWNLTAIVSNAQGTDSQTWSWDVAQGYAVYGYVKNLTSSLVGSTVIGIMGNIARETITNATGGYNLSFRLGNYTILANGSGYLSNSTMYSISGSDLPNTNFTLYANPHPYLLFNNISEIYGYNHRTEEPFLSWEATILSNANLALSTNWSAPVTLGGTNTRGEYVRSAAIYYQISKDISYCTAAKQGILNISKISYTNPPYGFMMAYIARDMAFGYDLIVTDCMSAEDELRARDSILELSDTIYDIEDAKDPDFSESMGRSYSSLAIVGLALSNHTNTSVSTNVTELQNMGNSDMFVSDSLHSTWTNPFGVIGGGLFNIEWASDGMDTSLGYDYMTRSDFTLMFHVYNYSTGINLLELYPLAKNSIVPFWEYYPNHLNSNIKVQGNSRWYFQKAYIGLLDDANKSYALQHIDRAGGWEALPGVYGNDSLSYILPYTQSALNVDDFVMYLVMGDYSNITRSDPPYKNHIGSGYIYQTIRNGWNNDSDEITIATDNSNTGSSRNAAHHDQMSIEYYGKGNLLVADGSETKELYPNPNQAWSILGNNYGEFDYFHNAIRIEDPRTPFSIATNFSNSTSRGAYRGDAIGIHTPAYTMNTIDTPQLTYLEAEANISYIIVTLASHASLSSPIQWNRSIFSPNDYFVVIDTVNGTQSWKIRNDFRLSSMGLMNYTVDTTDTTDSEFGNVTGDLYIQNMSYDWLSKPHRTEDNNTGISTFTNIKWVTTNIYNNQVNLTIDSFPNATPIVTKYVTRIGGTADTNEVYLPEVSLVSPETTQLTRITILQSNYNSVTPLSVTNISSDLSTTGVEVDNGTVKDVIISLNNSLSNVTLNGTTTDAKDSFARYTSSSLEFIAASNVSVYTKSITYLNASNRLKTIFMNVSGNNRTIIAEGTNGTNVTVYAPGTNYTITKNGLAFTDWVVENSTHLKINMTFSSPATYQLNEESSGVPDYIPPAPIYLTNNQGNFWVNHTWSPGSGNVTDSYNVSINGTWTNGTTAIYNNSSIPLNGWSNLTVWAYNVSGNGTLSLLAITNNTQLSTPSTPSSTTSSFTSSLCNDLASWGTVGFALIAVLLTAIAGGMALMFMGNSSSISATDIVKFTMIIGLVTVMGLITVALLNPIYNILGC